MFLAQPEDNNAVYKCEANNIILQQPLSAEITLSVQCKIPAGYVLKYLVLVFACAVSITSFVEVSSKQHMKVKVNYWLTRTTSFDLL